MQTVKSAPDAAAVRVQFGTGVRRTVATKVARLGAIRALILSAPGRSCTAAEVAPALGTAAAGTFGKATMHTPPSRQCSKHWTVWTPAPLIA